MCGRTSCTLNKDVVPLACSTVTLQVPKWKEAPCGGHYETSTNVPPTAYTPVLFQGKNDYMTSFMFTNSRVTALHFRGGIVRSAYALGFSAFLAPWNQPHGP